MTIAWQQTPMQLVSWCFEPSQPQRITSGLTQLRSSYSCYKPGILWSGITTNNFVFSQKGRRDRDMSDAQNTQLNRPQSLITAVLSIQVQMHNTTTSTHTHTHTHTQTHTHTHTHTRTHTHTHYYSNNNNKIAQIIQLKVLGIIWILPILKFGRSRSVHSAALVVYVSGGGHAANVICYLLQTFAMLSYNMVNTRWK